MLEDFLVNTLGVSAGMAPQTARLLRIRLRGLTDQQIEYILTRLAAGYTLGATDDSWVGTWDGRFTQMGRRGVSAQDMLATVRYLTAGATGDQIEQLFADFIRGQVHSDEIAQLMLSLMTGPEELDGDDGLPMVIALRAGPLNLTPRQLVTFVDELVQAGLSPTNIHVIQQFLTAHGAAALAGFAGPERPGKVVELAQSIHACALTPVQVVAYFAAHAPLTAAQALELALWLPFRWIHDLLGVANMCNLIHGALPDCNNVFRNVVRILVAAQARGVPDNALVRIFPYCADIPKLHLSCHENLIEFLKKARRAMIAGNANGRSWSEVLNVVDRFNAAGRRNAGAAAGAGAVLNYALPGGRTLQCNVERRLYFLRAHTLRYCDFTIMGRTHDNITFWPGAGTTFPWITGIIRNSLCVGANQARLGEICDVAEGGNYSCQFVGDYEVGVIRQGMTTVFPLMHFMPAPTHAGIVIVHKDLLAAIAHLFA